MASRKKLLLIGLLMVAIAALAACGPGGGGGGSTTGQTINVEGGEFFYQPVDINAKPGERVNVNFKNAGTVEHTFVIKDINFKLVAQPGQTVKGTFTAPSAAGTHEIHCDVPGHTEAGMIGKLTVVAANN